MLMLFESHVAAGYFFFSFRLFPMLLPFIPEEKTGGKWKAGYCL